MSFQLTRTHTSVVLAATTIAASLVVIPSLAEGTGSSDDSFCSALVGAQGRISDEYNPVLARYAAAAEGKAASFAADPAREAQLRRALSDAQAALESAKAGANQPNPSVGDAPAREAAPERGLDWVDWSKVDDATQARIIEALIVQKMNVYRANAGLPELVVSDTVTLDARAWSQHMSDTDDFNHDSDYKFLGVGKLDGGDTTYAGENIAYNHRENFGDKWGAYGTSKNPMQAADALFEQWKNSPGHDKNMLAQNNVVGVGVHIAKHGQYTRIYGTQKFYGLSGGTPNAARFHTTGDVAGAYGFDSGAFRANNTNYVSGLAGSGEEQRANSWQNKVGALPGSVLPVALTDMPAKAGSEGAGAATPAPEGSAASVDASRALADAQAAVDRAQAELDAYLAASAGEQTSANLADIDAQLDRVADAIASATTVHPEKDGGVTVRGDGQAGRYLTANEYRDALTSCTTITVSPKSSAPASPSEGSGVAADPSVKQPAPAPSASADPGAPAASSPSEPAVPSVPSAAGDGGNTASAPGSSNGSEPVHARTSISSSASPAAVGSSDAPSASEARKPSQARAHVIAATGSSALWVGVGAVAVLVAGAGAVVASRRAKR